MPAVDAVTKFEPLTFPWQTPDPFLFCVHHDDDYPAANAEFGPDASLAGRNLGQDFAGKDGWRMYHGRVVPGFPSHPHRGFETVTVVRKGLIDHADSLGAAARYGFGDVQWLTAGRGIQHAEMFPLLDRNGRNPIDFFQIWLNLPKSDKMVAPHFKMLWADTIPRTQLRDAQGRTIDLVTVAGKLTEATAPTPTPPPSSWAARADTDVAIWTIQLAPHAVWTLPAAAKGSNRMLYFFKGDGLQIGTRSIPSGQAITMRGEVPAVLQASATGAELLMLQGRPIAEPVAQYGPFVMNTMAEIQQTYADYQRTQFGGWPWPRHDPVHGSEPARFAKRPDGQVERPA
jgi:redox-sensitive bicupin YhaK (pirin superfamily)